jgi:hypothetical protein
LFLLILSKKINFCYNKEKKRIITMDRNAILDQIVQSASEELTHLDNADLQKVASSEENKDIEIPLQKKAPSPGLLNKVASQNTEPQLPAEDEVVAVLKKEAQELVKTASVIDDEELDLVLEKVAMEAGLELAELEKTAEEFGERAAQAFLRTFGIEG